ncbi:zinc finger protein 883 isoform X1 [Drosophila eugracilis]|uniref:zinc finger protein 883 isoform X1 n=1 Tax=Drosophila eugracilis TaxID=29029 RepID=UPI001BDA7E21|nr:zinc finger protein 883 isoform X1 [Drosophila eugracilis]
METCRTCAISMFVCDFENGSNNSHFLDLHHPNCWPSEMAQIRLQFVNWNLKISPNDGLPQKICSDCFTKFCSINAFRVACQEAQLKLSNIYDKIDASSLDVEHQEELDQAEENQGTETSKPTTTVSVETQQPNTASETIQIFVDAVDIDEENGEEEQLPEDLASQDLTISYACKFCLRPQESYQLQQLLLEHINTSHDPEQPYNCPECEACFQDAASRTVHLKNSHVEKQHACEVCGKKYSDRHNLRHHVEKYHSETDFECALCEKRFYTRKSLNYHMKWHNPERQFKCRHVGCERLFISQRHLMCHEATHSGTSSRKSEHCGFCGKTFIHLKTLRWHIYRQHGGEKPYKCANCSEVFASYAEKRIHMLERHRENLTAIERSECMLCRQPFTSESDLIHHMSVEHLQRPGAPVIANNKRVLQQKRERQYSGLFQCGSCTQRFNMKSALERHAAVHSEKDRPHACPHCSKRFKRAQDMKWHIKTHEKEKPNVCDVCGKAFALKYVLTQHRLSHEVLEKNFKCNVCGRAYLFEKSLRLHQRVHTGKTYYKCDLCQERFVTHIKLKTHMQKTHASQPHSADHPLDDLINIVIS